jgi:hypothetical protein
MGDQQLWHEHVPVPFVLVSTELTSSLDWFVSRMVSSSLVW